MSKVKVELCMGTTCFVMGSSGLSEFYSSLSEPERAQVEVKHSPCLGFCKDQRYGRAPYARIDGEIVSEASAHKLAELIKKKLRA